MPKGRHLKPDFFTDKHIVAMSPLARLLYQGLWCYAADCGHLDDEPVELKMRILPADNCDVDELLDEVVWHHRIIRKDGVIELPNLAEHQKPDKRYMTLCDACKADDVDPDERKRWGLHKRWHTDRDITKAGCEFCDGDSPHVVTTKGAAKSAAAVPSTETKPQVTSAHVVTSTGPRSDHVVDGDGDGDGEVMVKGSRKKRPTTIPDDWAPTEAHRAVALEERVNLDAEAKKFRDSNVAKGRTYVDWDAAFRNWLRSPYAIKTGPAPEVTDPAALPPVEPDWRRMRPSR